MSRINDEDRSVAILLSKPPAAILLLLRVAVGWHLSYEGLPLLQVNAVLAAQKKTSRQQREYVVVYYVMALALFMQVPYREVLRSLLEGWAWLLGPQQAVKITGKSGISQARTRLGGSAAVV